MPRIFDNIELQLLEGLTQTLEGAASADFCIGYLSLRGWGSLADHVDRLDGHTGTNCRVLVGMYRPPEQEERDRLTDLIHPSNNWMDGPTAARLRQSMAENFKEQIEFGIPTKEAEATLRKLARQIREGKVQIRAFLRYPLHAKLYLVRRKDLVTPLVGFLGSSNLTFSGLSKNGELNVDVVDQDAAQKLQGWFDSRWGDPFSVDLSDELANLIETSWAREDLISPYLLYLKMAYHLSEDARVGENQFHLPHDLEPVLLDFQTAAVKLAARLLYKRGGVLLGDVVGLGKTLMATAVAKIFQEDEDSSTLIICPPKLTGMWQWYADQYHLVNRVLSLGNVTHELSDMRRYATVVIDESHNLRNREGKRYRAISDYIRLNEPHVILLTATPYNKQYNDLSNQIRLFVDENQDLGIRPERFFREKARSGYSELDFTTQYQTSPRSLRAFEQSPYAEDWRDLMRLFMVRRTRSFITRNYAQVDAENARYFVMLGGKPNYFPERKPLTLAFPFDGKDPNDQYARLLTDQVVETIANLRLPRYGLANYIREPSRANASANDRTILDNLARAGRRLIGFSRTNLFKRLESDGNTFLVSIRRHILRNMVDYYAISNHLPLPIGTQDAALMDTAVNDLEDELADQDENGSGPAASAVVDELAMHHDLDDLSEFSRQAERIYQAYAAKVQRKRFQWIDSGYFLPQLAEDLLRDSRDLLGVLRASGSWQPELDAKLNSLVDLLTVKHPQDKVIVFTQFADTAQYLGKQLEARGITDLGVITSQTPNPMDLVRRFSPGANGGLPHGASELRILIATDVLAEGQNLQDAHITVNFDLPWAIIRLIQRTGRLDRIGQKHPTILVYSFMPLEGIEQLIRLRDRLFVRLRANEEVIGSDEIYFSEQSHTDLRDLYTEKPGILDDDSEDQDVDLTSIALEVWNHAPPEAREKAEALPPIAYATRAHQTTDDDPAGVLTYLRMSRNSEKYDLLVRVDERGEVASQSLAGIFQAAACAPGTPPLPPLASHYELVAKAAQVAFQEVLNFGGQLGNSRSIRRQVYERLGAYRDRLMRISAPQGEIERLEQLIDVAYRYQLKEGARDSLSRQLKLGIPDADLLEMVWRLYEDGRLVEHAEEAPIQTQILCSMGLKEV